MNFAKSYDYKKINDIIIIWNHEETNKTELRKYIFNLEFHFVKPFKTIFYIDCYTGWKIFNLNNIEFYDLTNEQRNFLLKAGF